MVAGTDLPTGHKCTSLAITFPVKLFMDILFLFFTCSLRSASTSVGENADAERDIYSSNNDGLCFPTGNIEGDNLPTHVFLFLIPMVLLRIKLTIHTCQAKEMKKKFSIPGKGEERELFREKQEDKGALGEHSGGVREFGTGRGSGVPEKDQVRDIGTKNNTQGTGQTLRGLTYQGMTKDDKDANHDETSGLQVRNSETVEFGCGDR